MPAVSLTACSALLAACGSGGPRLSRADAARLGTFAHRIAREGECAQARDIRLLRMQAIALVNAGKVPAALQEPLLSAVGALGELQPLCLPKVAASTPSPPPSRPAPAARSNGHGRGHRHGHGHGHRRRE